MDAIYINNMTTCCKKKNRNAFLFSYPRLLKNPSRAVHEISIYINLMDTPPYDFAATTFCGFSPLSMAFAFSANRARARSILDLGRSAWPSPSPAGRVS